MHNITCAYMNRESLRRFRVSPPQKLIALRKRRRAAVDPRRHAHQPKDRIAMLLHADLFADAFTDDAEACAQIGAVEPSALNCVAGAWCNYVWVGCYGAIQMAC